jgi:transcriptional regulator GlxA family with amidase domain
MLQVPGETPGEHQRRLRLDRAAWLLLTSHATVLDVALETVRRAKSSLAPTVGFTPAFGRFRRGKQAKTFHAPI